MNRRNFLKLFGLLAVPTLAVANTEPKPAPLKAGKLAVVFTSGWQDYIIYAIDIDNTLTDGLNQHISPVMLTNTDDVIINPVTFEPVIKKVISVNEKSRIVISTNHGELMAQFYPQFDTVENGFKTVFINAWTEQYSKETKLSVTCGNETQNWYGEAS